MYYLILSMVQAYGPALALLCIASIAVNLVVSAFWRGE